jgi:hypothetical protein
LLAYNGFLAILKKMPVSSVSPVKPAAIAGQKPAHKGRDTLRATEKQKMDVIIHQGPGKSSSFGLFGELTEAGEEIFSILIVAKYPYPFDPANHDVMQGSGSA